MNSALSSKEITDRENVTKYTFLSESKEANVVALHRLTGEVLTKNHCFFEHPFKNDIFNHRSFYLFKIDLINRLNHQIDIILYLIYLVILSLIYVFMSKIICINF